MEIQARSNVDASSHNHFLKVAVSMQFLVSLWRGGGRPDVLSDKALLLPWSEPPMPFSTSS